MSIRDLIIQLGGIRPTARALGLSKGSVQRWSEQGYLPRRRLDEVRTLARRRGVRVTDAELLGIDGRTKRAVA